MFYLLEATNYKTPNFTAFNAIGTNPRIMSLTCKRAPSKFKIMNFHPQRSCGHHCSGTKFMLYELNLA